MNLRKKFLIFLIIIFFLLGFINIIPQIYIIYPGFKKIEQEDGRKNIKLIKKSLFKEINHLDSICKDWAFWDDTYFYIKNRNKSYEKSNLIEFAFLDLKINIIGIYDKKINKVWFKIYDLENKKFLNKENFFINKISYIIKRFNKGVKGFYKVNNDVLLLSINPVLKSNYSGPSEGFLIMGKFLNEIFVSKLKKETGINFELKHIEKLNLKKDLISIVKGDYLILKSYLNDIFKRPILELSVKNKRKITNFAIKVIQIEIFSYIALCLIVLFFMSNMINSLIITPLENIKNFILHFQEEVKKGKKLDIKRNDEIGILAEAINNFIERIYHQRKNLIDLNKRLEKDIQKRRKAEKELLKSHQIIERLKRMESLALLAGGVAHDLNNILSGIVTYPELLLLDKELPEKYRKKIEKIKEAGEKAAKVVEDLLNITRTIHFIPEIINLNEIVKDFLESPELKKILKMRNNIEIKTYFEKNLFPIEGSKIHLNKVIMNLVYNSIEAIEEKGIIKIITENCILNKSFKGFMEVPPREYAILKISDNGKGIPKDNIDRIFEPFYSTKVMGKSGTGLGLFIVWNTVKAHNGFIDVHSDKNGTEFILYFPKTEKKKEDLKNNINENGLIDGKNKKVVVIDDEKEQKDILRDILKILNFNPIVFERGEDALSFLKENNVSLVILDLILLKGKSGFETLNEIRQLKPDQKVLVVTGYIDDETIKKLKSLGVTDILLKPFSIYSLSKILKKISKC